MSKSETGGFRGNLSGVGEDVPKAFSVGNYFYQRF